ncbi:protein RST1 isoform X1 [Actinidia eriantha]|uniref:protein RST1 isoform X1 n=1 Tax=Actinidia eriantha TaxID=165200 RepID=UPI00258EBA99|nr:protein RST1 isoform X1 [Actinidia eriantha]
MDSYASLLERTRAPQLSLQRFAVISIFGKLRSAPPHLDSDSDAGREAIAQCLHSASADVVDQSVRELCRLVKDSKFDLSRALLELQSGLEGCDSRFVNVFVKGLGFLVRYGFQKNRSSFRFSSPENHPFVKVLSCRREVQSELVQQVVLFMAQSKHLGMVEICDFLGPFLKFSIIRVPFSPSLSMFVKDVITSLASMCCSFPLEAMPVIKLLMECLKYIPGNKDDELRNIPYFLDYIVDAYVVVLRHLVKMRLPVHEAQLCGAELLEAVFLLFSNRHHFGGVEPIVEVSKRLVRVQKELGLSYTPELSTVTSSLFVLLIQSEFEHDQLSILKLLIFLMKWRTENEFAAALILSEDFLFIFPILNLVSSPSTSVKQAATDVLSMLEKLLMNLLVASKKKLIMQGRFPPISRVEDIIIRLLQHLWSQDQPSLSSSFFLNFALNDGIVVNKKHNLPKTWASLVREYSTWIVERRKSALPISQCQESFTSAEMPFLLGAIASVLIMHTKLGSSAVDLLAVIGIMDPKLAVPMLLSVLFYGNIFSGEDKDINFNNMLLKLLGMLPSLASHPVMIPLIVQTVLPMLQKDAKPVLYATATRLLCKTWEINDRVFGSMQGVLHPKGFTQFMSERNVCISMAASIRDVCRKNPDRGVDLILSVSACIESQDPIIQALGFESLSHLCEADVVDFYTAWDVISKHVLDSIGNPLVAGCACLLLRWGAMDAEAYPEAARNVLQILWDVGTSGHLDRGPLWPKARVSAFDALTHYEVQHIQRNIPDFKRRNMELLTSETNPEVLRAMEVFEVKIITHEHITRRRFVKEKRVTGSKIEKLLDVFPQTIFASGNISGARQLPGAALLCFPLTPIDVTKGREKVPGLQDIHAKYKNALVEIAASLQLSRNILIALLSLQSWKAFMQRWMKASVIFLDAKVPSTLLDKTSKAANGILKIIRLVAEESIPRSGENVALALGAFCEVLPPSAHAIKSTASKFLLDWLFQYEHEHRQWSAAISLGLISSCLHVTDHKQKFQNIKALLEVASCSRSTLVKGACGVGLGFSCQDLLTRVDATDSSNLEKETYKIQEVDLLGKIVRALSQMICQFSPSSSDLLENLSVYFPLVTDDTDSYSTIDVLNEKYDDLEEDIWGIAGLVLGLGSCIGAVYRYGSHDAVHKIKAFIISVVPNSSPAVENSFGSEALDMVLSVGSCLALPFVVSFCRRVELMHDNELDHLVSGFRELISELVSVKKSSAFHQSLLMASCIGAGNLLASILNEGVHSLEVELIKDLLDVFRKSYFNPHPPLIHLGGMLGVVNALGAGAGTLVHNYPSPTVHNTYCQKESSHIMGPLLSSPVLDPQLTSLIQEMFLVAQNSNDHQLQQYAAWAISFLRHRLWFREGQNVDSSLPIDAAGQKSGPQSFSKDTIVMELSLWLMHLNYPRTGTFWHVYTIAAVLRCLSQAPRLPALDWGTIIRRCMKYEGQVAELLPSELALKKGTLREECLQLSLAHASQFNQLLSFLDELSDLSRFKTLELNLQSWILCHLAELIKVFSGSRLENLFDDVAKFLSSLDSDGVRNVEQKSLLRVSCWTGLYLCVNETPLDAQEYTSKMENCIEVLFSSLPLLQSIACQGMEEAYSVEWSEAIRCLAKARQSWLFNLLQVSKENLVEGDGDFSELSKKIQVKARLVRIGSIPLSELGKLKSYLLNTKSDGIWDVLIEVVAALQHFEGSIKRQWLLDVVEISCVTSYPSTALQFLGLLCGSSSKYMPLLIVDRHMVLSDLPVTLSSLLSDSSWEVVAEPVASYLWASTERFYDWAARMAHGDDTGSPHPIDKSENDMAVFLSRVMHSACVSLKDYLPPEKQLKLANLVVP